MNRSRLAVLVTLVLITVACGTGSTGFDRKPNFAPGEPGDLVENEIIEEILGSGTCDSTAPAADGSALLLCSNDPPAGLLSETLVVGLRPQPCPELGCSYDLEIPERELDDATELLPVWRSSSPVGVGPWRTAAAPLRRAGDPEVLRGEIVLPAVDEPITVQIALLVFAEGYAGPPVPPEGLQLEHLADLMPSEVSIIEIVIEPVDVVAGGALR